MGLGRAFYIVFFPQVCTLAALVLSIVTFFSGYEHAYGLHTVHFMTVDLTSFNVGGLANSDDLSLLNVSKVYTVGTNGWCQGQSKTDITECNTPEEPFYFSFGELLSSSGYSAISNHLSGDLAKYDNISKQVSWGVWGSFLGVMVLTFLQFLAGFFAICSRAGACCATFLSNLAGLGAIIGAALATGMYYVYTDKINAYGSNFGIKATLDASGLGFAWATVAAIILSDILYFFASCCGARRKRYAPVPEKEASFM